MLFWAISTLLIVLFIVGESIFLKKLKYQFRCRRRALEEEHRRLSEEQRRALEYIKEVETTITEQFLFYDTARKISPFLDRRRLLAAFVQELKYLGKIDDICFGDPPGEGYQVFKFGRSARDRLCVKSDSSVILKHLPVFIKLLKLCLERIRLYQRLQELSIKDSLCDIYNRRYFNMRYLEEFERAKRLALNLSFLMIDIDNFKKINDTYGHLVGDAVLRAVAKLIANNLREIDFVARFGGEEFSVILVETDKAGAIMVAERISSRISRQHIRAFDEMLNVTVSVGVASFPQNALHSDVLVEVADNALYKAKLSGRNRVCWF